MSGRTRPCPQRRTMSEASDDEPARPGAGSLPLRRWSAGRPVDPDRLAAEHPAIADELRSCLEVLRLAGRVEGSPAPGLVEEERRTMRRCRCWATSASSARSAAAAWGSSTRPSKSRSTAGWR